MTGLLLALFASCTSGTPGTLGDGDSGPTGACAWDDDDQSTQAAVLGDGVPASGFLCPVGDQDWYRFEATDDLVEVSLSIDAPVSSLNLTYSIWTEDGAEVVTAPRSNEAASSADALKLTHGLADGSYLMVVRDVGGDVEDVYHPYELSVSGASDPDVNEPNNSAEQATDATTATGFIAYRGDEDWYSVSSPARGLLHVQLEMVAGGIEPAWRIVSPDGEEVASGSNASGTREATVIEHLQATEDPGTWTVVVSDDDELDWDGAVSYSLSLSAETDPDENETNDVAADATELGELTCGTAWSSYALADGYLASTGDVDWYAVDLSGCSRGVLESEVSFSGTLPDDLLATLRFVKPVAGQSCEVDQDCLSLTKTCTVDLDCSGVGNTCLSTGYCAGAGMCLPEGECGAAVLSESASAEAPGSVVVSIPLRGQSRLYLVVADYQSDTWSLDNSYRLSTRARKDPDAHEPNETYTAGPPTSDDSNSYHTARATTLPLHDCTTGDCCDDTTWESGGISYSYDQDWFAYAHPCPGEDCMLAVHYEYDSGPVDPYMVVHAGSSAWYDNLASVVDSGSHPATSGVFGGLDDSDTCFYAWQGHSSDYHLSVRDTVFVSSSDDEGGSWDYDPDQDYRICIEKIAEGCQSPCVEYSDGCGSP